MADTGALAALAASRSSRPALLPPGGGSGDTAALLSRLRTVRRNRPALDLTVRREATARKGKSRGLLTQLGDAVKNLPAGIAHIGYQAGKTALFAPRAGVDLIRDPVRTLKDLGDTATLGLLTEGRGGFEKYAPLAGEVASSMHTTGTRLRHPTQYARAVDEGRIVDVLLEDVGNAAIVGGVAGKALGAGAAATGSTGLGRAAAITERASKLGGAVADAPISVPRALLTGLQERGMPALGRLPLGAVDETLGRRRTLGEIAPTRFTAHGREALALTRREARLADRERSALVRTGYKEGTGREKIGGNPTQAEVEAAVAVHTGQADVGRLIGDAGATGEQMMAALSPTRVPEAHLSPEGAQIAQQYLTDPTAHPRVARLVEVLGDTAERFTDQALEGRGRRRPLDEEQVTSNDPLPRERERFAQENRKALRKLGEQSPELQAELADLAEMDQTPTKSAIRRMKVEEGMRMLEQEEGSISPELFDAWNAFLDDPMSYAARWRKRMMESRRLRTGNEALDIEGIGGVPLRPSELVEQGVDPGYLPAGRPVETLPAARRAGTTAPAREGVTGDIRLTSEQTRGLGSEAPMSLRTIYGRFGDEARQIRLNELYRTLTDTEGRFATNATKILGEDELARIDADAAAEAQTRYPDGNKAEYERLRGDAIADAMAERGYEAWPVEGSATSGVSAATITPESPFLHAGMRKRLSKEWTSAELPLPLKAMEAINRKFKGAVLPWSIRWQVGDATSNMLLSAVAGDVDPITMIGQMRRLKKLSAEEQALLDARVQDTGLTFDETAWQKALPGRDEITWRRNPIKKLQRPGYRINTAINRTQRHAFYLAKLERDLARQGISLEDAGRMVEAGTESAAVRASIDKAVDQANDVLGAFDEMTPFERRYMRNLFPFYPWMRHITKLSARLAIDNPIRVLWIMRIGSIAADPDSELPDYLRGAVQTPFGLVDTNFLNPFADATGQSPLTPEGALRSLSPALKIGAAALTGADLNRGGLQLGRPWDSSRTDAFGRQSFNPLILPGRWDELAYVISQQIPQTRMLTNLAPQVSVGDVDLGPVARYGQGSMLKRGDTEEPLDTDPRLQELARLVSIPLPHSDEDVESMVASIRRRKG